MLNAAIHLPCTAGIRSASRCVPPRSRTFCVSSFLSFRPFCAHLRTSLSWLSEPPPDRCAWRLSGTSGAGASSMDLNLVAETEAEVGQRSQGVVVGGTFDRLHEGHCLLLTTALQAAGERGRLLVGISTGPLLANKFLPELIEPYEVRRHAVDQFVRTTAGSGHELLQVVIVPITEAAPLSAVADPMLHCIVVSQDTEKGAQAFNNARQALGLSPCKILVVATIANQVGGSEEKLSSSHRRRELLGTYLHRKNQERLVDGPLTTGPYMVGLTGGIAAGKSLVRELIKKKGGEVLDCDSLGHLSYIPGTATYDAIVRAFGSSILLPDGSMDRRVLSSIVFSDPQQMNVLTGIVWPAVSALVAEAREAMAERQVQVCLAEAALLLEAHWEKHVHEVWVVVTPQDISRTRLMSRNNITKEEADKRINSQMTSEERVALADVVIYNGWTEVETGDQVNKAWELLLQRIETSKAHDGAAKQQQPLWARWVGLMGRLRVDPGTAEKWWKVLETLYTGPSRHYHSLARIQALYRHFHEYAHYISEPQVVQLAFFFKYVSYDPLEEDKSNSETKSALLFQDFASDIKLDKTDETKVTSLILQTSDLLGHPRNRDFLFFSDFLNADLGATAKEYEDHLRALRQDFAQLDEQTFRERRVVLLKSALLDPDTLYRTSPFRDRYLSASKRNMTRELKLYNAISP